MFGTYKPVCFFLVRGNYNVIMDEWIVASGFILQKHNNKYCLTDALMDNIKNS